MTQTQFLKMAIIRNIVLFILVGFLAACSFTDDRYDKDSYGKETAPAFYTVKRGDTLFSISWRFGMTQKEIQKLNGISNPNRILVGQKLRLSSKHKPKSVKSSKPVFYAGKGWVWPMRGSVIRKFNPNAIGGNGTRISGKEHQTVNAAEGGVVAYQGSGLKGYGNVVIIKQANGILTAYGFLSKTYVKEGQKVVKKQKIGTVGYANNNVLALHFEVRKDGKPVNPMQYIGSRYHF